MKPKIEAAITFIEGDKKRKALITHANTLKEALAGKNGTLISY
jgi:carbamate kinase